MTRTPTPTQCSSWNAGKSLSVSHVSKITATARAIAAGTKAARRLALTARLRLPPDASDEEIKRAKYDIRNQYKRENRRKDREAIRSKAVQRDDPLDEVIDVDEGDASPTATANPYMNASGCSPMNDSVHNYRVAAPRVASTTLTPKDSDSKNCMEPRYASFTSTTAATTFDKVESSPFESLVAGNGFPPSMMATPFCEVDGFPPSSIAATFDMVTSGEAAPNGQVDGFAHSTTMAAKFDIDTSGKAAPNKWLAGDGCPSSTNAGTFDVDTSVKKAPTATHHATRCDVDHFPRSTTDATLDMNTSGKAVPNEWLQIPTVCTSAAARGITHTGNAIKTESNLTLHLESAVSLLPLDVTVVISNNGTSEYYYSQLTMQRIVSSVTDGPTPATPVAPVAPSAPAAPPSAPVAPTTTPAGNGTKAPTTRNVVCCCCCLNGTLSAI